MNIITSPRKLALAIAQVIEDHPGVWGQNADAQDKDGNSVNVTNPHAVKFCARGMAMRIRHEGGATLEARSGVIDIPGLMDANDGNGRNAVIALLRRYGHGRK